MQFGKTQSYVSNKIFGYLNEEYDVYLQIDAIKINPFGEFNIKGALIKDHHNDTLIYAENIKGELVDIQNFKNNILSFNNINISNGIVNDIVYSGEHLRSLSVFTSKFAKKKKSEKKLKLNFVNATVNNLRYTYTKENERLADFKEISGEFKTLNVNGVDVDLVTDSLKFKDIYGIEYNNLSTHYNYSISQMSFAKSHVVTNNSDIYFEALFNYDITDFSDFINKVNLQGEITKGHLSLKDINKIYPHFENYEVFKIKSKVKGTLNDLTLIDADITSINEELNLQGNLFLINSFKNRECFDFRMEDGSMKSTALFLKKIVPNTYNQNLLDTYYGVTELDYKGNLHVTLDNFEVKGKALTNIGKVDVDGYIDQLNSDNKIIDFKVSNGYLRKVQQVVGLKNIFFNANIKGVISQNEYDLKGKTYLRKIQYDNFKLSNSNLKFKINQNYFSADFISKDTSFAFTANIEQIKENKTELYNVCFDITKAKLDDVFLDSNFYQKNITSVGEFSFKRDAKNLLLKGQLVDLNIKTDKDSLNIANVDVSLESLNDNKKIHIKSENVLDLEAEGVFKFKDFKKLVENALYKFIPGTNIRSKIVDQTFAFKMEVYPNAVKAFTNDYKFDNNISLSGVIDAKGDKGVIVAKIPSISSKNIKVDSLEIVLDNSNKWINSNISANQVRFKKQIYEDLSLLGKKVNDTLFVRSNFQSDKINNRAIFYLTTQKQTLSLGIENIYIKYLKSVWVNKENKENKINYDYEKGDWDFSQISFVNQEQEFEFDGDIKKNQSKNLKLQFKKINLSEILPEIDSLNIGGIASGEVFFKEKQTLLKPDGFLKVENLRINGVEYGNMNTSIHPNDKKLGYDINFNLIEGIVKNIDANGEILVDENNFANSKIDLQVKLNKLKLSSLGPLGGDVLSNVRGSAIGDFQLSGKLNDFNSYGIIDLKKAGLNFPYLNVDYNFIGDTKVVVDGKKFIFNNINVKDVLYDTDGILYGEIKYDKYNNWNLDINIDAKNLLVLNTIQKEESKYFGTAFMRGNAEIVGPTSDLAINITGRTLPNTKFVLPISDVKELEENKFVYFKKLKEDNIDNEKGTIGGIRVALNIEITKDALGEIVIDQTSGTSLQGRTDGRLLIDIDRLFNIKMYGDLSVAEGTYNFKYGNIVNKPFVVKKGGTISWNGDPYKAQLNIEALHQVKANPKVLLDGLSVNRKIDIDLITKITGELFNSNQDFFITIPNANSIVSSELDFKLNIDQNSKMRQFFSLLVSKSFYDENNENNTSSVIANTTSEIFSNIITEVFNKEDDKFRINFGYTSGETSDAEELDIDNQIDIGLATAINDRILINGKLGVPVGTNTQTSIVGEVKIEFLINKEGSLRSSVFNRQNEIQYSEEEEGYTQGVGLTYQIDFNNLKEMIEKVKSRTKNQKKRGKQ